MTEEVETSFWISFFVEAGIPPAASANYAIIFTDNRIQKHMLLDLNKEYLKDMGVNVLGDIIAILKHAKLYHEKAAREKVLANKGSTTVSVKKATEHLNELLLKDEPVKPAITASKPASASARAVLKPSPPKKLKVLKSEIEIVEKEEESPDEELEELKRKVIPPSKQPQQQTKKLSVVSTQPSNKKTSVFERLGDSSVTSTTPEAPDSSAAAAAKSSVFQRLGKSLKASEIEEVKAPLKLQTTVSTQPVTKKAIAAKPVKAMPEVTLRMDMEEAASKQSAKDRLTLRIGAEKSKEMKRVVTNKSTAGAGGIILKTSLQRTVRPPTVVSQTIKPKTVAVKPRSAASSTKSTLASRAGVKQRLGSVATVSASASSVGSSVFKRLGTTRNQS